MTGFERFAAALALTESDDDQKAWGDQGLAIGRWQMHPAFVAEWWPDDIAVGWSWDRLFHAALLKFYEPGGDGIPFRRAGGQRRPIGCTLSCEIREVLRFAGGDARMISMHRFLLIVAAIARCKGARTIGLLRRRRWRGCGEGNRRRVRRNLAQFSGRDCRQHVRGYDVLDAAQALVAPDREGGLVRNCALRRLSRLPRILSASPSRPIAREVWRAWTCPKCGRLNSPNWRTCDKCGFVRPALPHSHLRADRGARGAQQKITSPARVAARAGIPSARCDFVRSALAREAFAPPFAARRSTRNPHRADTFITWAPRLAIGDRGHEGRA